MVWCGVTSVLVCEVVTDRGGDGGGGGGCCVPADNVVVFSVMVLEG